MKDQDTVAMGLCPGSYSVVWQAMPKTTEEEVRAYWTPVVQKVAPRAFARAARLHAFCSCAVRRVGRDPRAR